MTSTVKFYVAFNGKAERKSFKQSIAIQNFILICRFAQTAIIYFILSGEKYEAILLFYEATIKEFTVIKYGKNDQAVNENILKCFSEFCDVLSIFQYFKVYNYNGFCS